MSSEPRALDVTEERVRALARDVLRRLQAAPQVVPACVSPWSTHPSHGLLPVPSGRDSEGPCLVEPAVACTHCGFCRSFGH